MILVTIPPRATPGTSPALRALGWGIVESLLSWGLNFSLILCSTCHFLRDLHDGVGLETFFNGKTQELVLEWQEKNNLRWLRN